MDVRSVLPVLPVLPMRPLALVLLAASACVSPEARDAPHVVDVLDAAEETAGSTEGPGFRSRTLFTSPRLSAHVTRVWQPLRAHYHAEHEETAYVLHGTARMRIGDVWHDLEPGDLVHVPRGVEHEVDVDGSATVLSLFAPPFDGSDRVFVEPAATRR